MRRFQMNNEKHINPVLSKGAMLIDKVHPCTDCPLRKLALQRPESVFAKIHTWHKTWWPGWQAHQARTCPLTANTGMHA